MKQLPFILAVIAAVCGNGCRQQSTTATATQFSGPPWFVDVTKESGLNFVHEVGSVPLDHYFMPHLLGSGVASPTPQGYGF